MVKADGYGHGADACAAAALAGGATRLAVATGAEAGQIGRRFPQVPLLTMGALTPDDLEDALAAGLGGRRLARRLPSTSLSARGRAQGRPVRVHVKYDSGMGRLGNPDPEEVLALARACAEDPQLDLVGVWTHFATADEPESDFFDQQLERFYGGCRRGQGRVPRASPLTPPTAPRSSASPRSHFDMARCGVAVYGLDPFQGDPAERGLEPALSLHSYVADVKRFAAGDSAGYGQTWRAPAETWVGVLPLGYGDGVRRGALEQRRGADPRPPPPARRHRLDGQRHGRPRPRDRGRARRRGGADRRSG